MLTSANDLRRVIEFLDNHESRLRRLETQEIGVVTAGVVCLQTILVSQETDEVQFEDINQGFLHLWLWILSKTPGVAGGCANQMSFNGDTGNNYKYYNKYHIRTGVVDSETATGGTGTTTNIVLGSLAGNPEWAACEVNIFNYTLVNTTRRSVIWKSWRYDTPGGEIADFVSLEHGGGEWMNTAAAVTSITITAGGGTCQFDVGSMFTLMGVCAI